MITIGIVAILIVAGGILLGGAYVFLSDGHEEIGDEGGEQHHIDYFEDYVGGELRIGSVYGIGQTEWQAVGGGEKKHPLHERHHAVARDERTEHTEVDGEAEAVEHD